MSTKFQTGMAKGEDSFKAVQEAAMKAVEKIGGGKINLSVVFASAKYDYQAVVNGVRKATDNAPLIGCSTAGEFTEENVGKESVVCAVISSDTHQFFTGLGTGLREDEIKTLKEASAKFPSRIEGYPYLSAINLHDGLAGKGEETALATLNALGPQCKFAGGSAGDDLKMKETYVFTDDKVATDAVSLALIASQKPVAIAVRHGHSPVSPPLTVTKSEANIVYELNGRPAFEVWKESLREKAKELDIDVDNLRDGSEELARFLTRYEAGLLTGAGYKIRWPGLTTKTDGPMVFACSIPEGTVLRTMESPVEDQIAAARNAAQAAVAAAGDTKIVGAFVFECVVRAVILGDDLPKAVNAVHEVVGVPLVGFETYGELCMEMGQMSGFHNTTTVVMLIPE